MPSRLPPVVPARRCIQAGGVLRRRAVRLGDVRDRHRAEEHDHHRRVDRVALAAVAGHLAVHEHQRRGMISTVSISKKLLNAVGFSNGCAELVLKKPPPLVPSILDRLLRGDRAHRDRVRRGG